MKRGYFLTGALLLSLAASCVAARNVSGGTGRVPDEEVLSIGTRKQLLVDDYVVSKLTNLNRELCQATKENGGQPLIVQDRPWENCDIFRLGSVFRDGDKFRLFYQMSSDLMGYAESEDGINWVKPNLGFYEYQGSKENNIVDSRSTTCYLDPHETDPAHKYKAAYCHDTVKAALAHSPDGFHWTDYNNGEPVTGRAADTINSILWDEDAKAYRLYTRIEVGEGLYAGTLDEIRGSRDMINPDIKANPTNWKTVREWKFDREGPWEYKRRQMYALNGWIYEGVHFGLMWSYEWAGAMGEGPYDIEKRHERDIMNFYIVTTRGNEMWDLAWVYARRPHDFSKVLEAHFRGPRVMVGVPLIPRGPDGSFDKDWVQPSCNIVTWNDKHWIYYNGSRERHDVYRIRTPDQTRWQCAIGLATLRLDGFVCLEAKDEPGTVLTKPFRLEGNRLEVNVDAKGGEVKVEVLDSAGEPMPGFFGAAAKAYRGVDELRLQPEWGNGRNLADLKGKVVRLRFDLKNAKLYAFQVKA